MNGKETQDGGLELVSFKLCPFVQRSVITLLHKKARFRITYIDLADPPPWFREISPLGKVPLLRVGDAVIFESAVINEYIDETHPPPLHPADPLRRAVNRAWIEFGSECLGDLYRIVTAADETALEKACATLRGKLERMEGVLGEGPFFNGEAFSLVDAAWAPLLMRLELLRPLVPVYGPEALPRLARWSEVLLAAPEVRESVVPEFETLFREHILERGGALAARLAAS
ncbi:glutathione S-transferase family protein [Inmirania thermothiophila]|uniref:glutathione transferase n=1 Tax=Inmirania thermothiophila TaxID=1750597 RepID=A0A3N1Y877_9GAMM|nr:glutathione S-transferase family protein [Inmirania thermothiophila]ROR35024.1 glutathione S-transferase [Inmirania thermothiophila]